MSKLVGMVARKPGAGVGVTRARMRTGNDVV